MAGCNRFRLPSLWAVLLLVLSCGCGLPAAAEDKPHAEGNSLFNQYCAHCHGPNAEQGERPRDLRRLKIRYGDNREEMFRTTVAKGRPEKGMPSWAGVLGDDVLQKIWGFLESVQQ